MKSILQEDRSRCFICEGNPCGDPLDKHHVFSGPCRGLSEKYGLTVYLHHARCHIFGPDSVHRSQEVRRALERMAQIRAMEVYGWSEAEFIKIFMRSYL